MAPEDLTREPILLGCERMEFGGASRPKLGDFPLLARIGHGGMGVVYYGLHPRLETEVAVKILPAETQSRHPDLVRRFVREARLAARMNSDFLVRVFDVNRDPASGLYYLVMEYVRGVSAGRWLDAALAAGSVGVPEDQALDVCIAATAGLAAAHERGTIHRDVKPDNILIPSGDRGHVLTAAKLADLGLAGAEESTLPVDQRLTGTRLTIMGTPGYAAPEQLEDPTKAKKPADVFSMGATLYALLTGRGPFVRSAVMESVLATMRDACRPMREVRPAVSAGTAALVEVCLQREPAKRYADAAALLEALRICRRAYGKNDASTADVTTSVVRLAQRSEVGQAVASDLSSDTRVTSGTLRIDGAAPGAHVSLRRSGGDPLAYAGVADSDGSYERDHVEAGTYELTVALAGYHAFSTSVQVEARAKNAVRVSMREKDGIVAIDSDPRGAEVCVDGAPVGISPIPALAVLPGSHTITLTLAGHDKATRTVVVRGGVTIQLGTIQLEPLGLLDLTAAPEGVQFEMDAKAVHDVVELKPGTYRLTARREGYEPQEVEVIVAARASVEPVLESWRRHGWSLLSDVERWDSTTPADRRRVARTIAERLADFDLRAMETFQCGGQRHEVGILVHRPTGLEFVIVPGGRFEMGSPPDEPGRRTDERTHFVDVTPFLLARTPVTQAAWESAMGANPSQFRGPGLPVHGVSHAEAVAFCEKIGLALPTEAQWEYACRSGTKSPWCIDDAGGSLEEHAWFEGNAGDGPRPVGTRRPNAFGVFDLHGNVWEWCSDGYAEYPFEPCDASPRGPSDSPAAYRVFRGGGWNDPPERLRAAQRAAFRPDYRFADLGFRPARTLTAALGAQRSTASGGGSRAEGRESASRAVSVIDATPLLADVAKWDAATPAQRRRVAESIAAREAGFSFVALSTFEAGGVKHEIALLLHAPTELEFALLPGGSLPGPATTRTATRRTGTLSRAAVAPLLVARTPVHQASWRKVMESNPSFYVGDRLPVEQVDLAAATEYCKRAGLALPGDAQWEYACRAGTEGGWCCGDEAQIPEFAWYERNAGRSTHPVGEKRPNAFGLFDVMGDVWEWCRPEGPGEAREARIRGGAWTSEARQLQSSWFLSYPVGTRMGILGFRPVRALSAPEEKR